MARISAGYFHLIQSKQAYFLCIWFVWLFALPVQKSVYTCDFMFQTVREAFAKTESPVVGKLLLASFVSVRAERNAHFDQTFCCYCCFVVVFGRRFFFCSVLFVAFWIYHFRHKYFSCGCLGHSNPNLSICLHHCLIHVIFGYEQRVYLAPVFTCVG